MHSIRESGFDRLASEYDAVWSTKAAGTQQRQAVWRWVDPLFHPGDFVLDLGCGTGVDGFHFMSAGVHVYGIDSSSKMIEIAKSRGVDADCRRIEDLHRIPGEFDGVLSNFGALNCVESLPRVASGLARLVRRNGYVALCLLGRICLWEIAHYLLQGVPAKAFRRLEGHTTSSLGVRVWYPSRGSVISAFRRDFRLRKFCGIGFGVPPSYVAALSDSVIERLAALDRRVAHWPLIRSLTDHSLYIFQRL
jgi:ubiquinone/menaquinone biosynthesis C-methylase UbiE